MAATDRFCAKCGSPQGAAPAASAAAPRPDFAGGISNRNAEILCYIPWVGWVAAIVVLASERFRHETQVRFHAFQGLYLFVAWLLVEWVVSPMFWWGSYTMHRIFPEALQLVILIAWIIMIIKVSHGENYRLPIIGELADRSVTEQRT